MSKKKIKATLIEIDWLFRNSSTFDDMVLAISELERNFLFESSLVVYLLNEFWTDY